MDDIQAIGVMLASYTMVSWWVTDMAACIHMLAGIHMLAAGTRIKPWSGTVPKLSLFLFQKKTASKVV